MEHWLDALWTPAKDVPAMLVKQDGRVLPVTVMCIDGRYKFQYWIRALKRRPPAHIESAELCFREESCSKMGSERRLVAWDGSVDRSPVRRVLLHHRRQGDGCAHKPARQGGEPNCDVPGRPPRLWGRRLCALRA